MGSNTWIRGLIDPPFSTTHFFPCIYSFLPHLHHYYSRKHRHRERKELELASEKIPNSRPRTERMTATSALSLALPVASLNRRQAVISASAKPSSITPALTPARGPVGIKAASPPSPLKEQAVTGLTALALTAAMVVPEMAEAAQPGLSPSLKNFLFSIVSGGVVVGAIIGAVIGVANFDPVKRT